MGAYSYLETDEFTGGIVFAKSNIEARRIGANLLNMDDIGGMEVKRRKDLDRFEETGVPAWLLVSEGWRFECLGCGMQINEDEMEDAGLPVTGIVGVEHGHIYCCHVCRMQRMAEYAACKAFGEAFLDMLKGVVTARFPDIEPCFGEYRHHVYVPTWCSPYVVQQAKVHFSFPGMKIGPASLVYQHQANAHGSRITGPVKPEFYCCNGDREAFEALAGRSDQ
ncbi:hypothetical protein [Maritimibacter sp. DP1N21-5]|uniref:hypothetical protein n=1 Tax=Maritimibacter sp. DP1N21-5 TaxID=2836867 RepID=UPI001C47D056|nr:hypothetical protein [Maritimibacter sp. DP1N21-5]MBV7408715.1 hypothetical protein [Maritimibacter sp. DP1N21-5]